MNKKLICLVSAVLILFTSIFVPTTQSKAAGVTQLNRPIAGGASHSIALKNDGTIWTWGSNTRQQLGVEGKPDGWPTPEEVDISAPTVSVAAGNDFSMSLLYDGNVYVLGSDGYSPIYRVSGLSSIVDIAASLSDGLALDKDGVLWQWNIGLNPRMVSGLADVAAIAAGGSQFLALTFSGEVWSWNSNESGQPRRVENLANIISVAAGLTHYLAVANDGSVYAWGSNTYGQLGDVTKDEHSSPVKVEGVSNVIQVSAGFGSSMALTKDHEIYTWGYGEYGQLGDGTNSIIEVKPIKIKTEGDPVYIASGLHHNFYLTSKGDLYAWGRNNMNQLGISNVGRGGNEPAPVKVLDNLAVTVVYTIDPLSGASPWAQPELSRLYAMELLPPMLWSAYKQNVTRAEFAALLVNVYEAVKGKNIDYPKNTNFLDIDGHVYEIEIRKAFKIELVAGVSETSFNPEGRITRQEAAKMICSFVTIMENLPMPSMMSSLAYYRDASMIAGWAVPFVAYAHDYDIMQGSDGKFDPLNNLTREQTLAMVYRTIQKYNWVQ